MEEKAAEGVAYVVFPGLGVEGNAQEIRDYLFSDLRKKENTPYRLTISICHTSAYLDSIHMPHICIYYTYAMVGGVFLFACAFHRPCPEYRAHALWGVT